MLQNRWKHSLKWSNLTAIKCAASQWDRGLLLKHRPFDMSYELGITQDGMENQINLSWRIKAESAQCERRGAEVCANGIKTMLCYERPLCLRETDNFICNNVRGGRHLSIRAHPLLASGSMRFPPYRPPRPSSFDLSSSVFSCPRRLAHNEIRRSPVVCYAQSRSSADIDNTRLTREPKKRKTLLFFCLPSGQKHDSICLSISAPRTKNIFRSVGVGGFCGTKCLLEHLVKKK